jgi:hypothetical protein
MARIPREFQKLEPGFYVYGSYRVKKIGVTKQDGSTVASYVATDEAGQEVAERKSAQELFELLRDEKPVHSK